ncbi:SBBP repeat-containing protein [Flavobacterium terrae]|uniref:Por secretion system C-terminal sorting domain-containing protein n=1 Tax=Flavobacterium terrae TaxID=415425 RepID=A0A1M6CYX8_9FLAO|nr:SBBP repeat-containing protein [Flavobacterium terrae]SHI66160.1 Por secretion system C-terminal sorting domain-containing protein [Flavobacterium terrae]
MKKTLLSSLLLISTSLLNAQSFEWAKSFGGTSSEQSLYMSIDAAGNIYTVGTFTGTVDFDPGADSTNLTSAGSTDIFIQKIDALGNFIWAKSFGGNSSDNCNSITIDGSGNIYMTGLFNLTVDFDPGTGTANFSSNGNNDIFVLKLDNSGNFVWAKTFGGISFDRGISTCIDSYGNIYTAGDFSGTVDFDPGNASSNITSFGSSNIFVQKMDSDGNFIWAKSFGGNSSKYCSSINLDSFGNIYTTGFFEGTIDFDPGIGTTNLTSIGESDIFVQKMDSDGNFIWAKSFGGTTSEQSLSLSIDTAGNIYTTGSFTGTVDFDPGVGTSQLSSAGLPAFFVQKMDSDGNFLWAKSTNGNYHEVGTSITVDNSGNVFATGYFNGTVDFDPGTGTAYLTSVGSSDIFLIKLDTSGNFIWAKSFGGTNSDYPKSTKVDATGNIYTTGIFYETADFDPGTGIVNLTSAGATDIFIQKLNPTTMNINEFNSSIKLSLFPNPTKGTFFLSFNQDIDDLEIIITDVQGKIISKEAYNTFLNANFELKGSKGVYYLTVKNSKGQNTIKVLKE